ncbi:MAG: hypothetical protein CLLPBCKN_001442 [Chroococcidiopsis cubana SAG 39.79]|nr:hypothetical protein [Chroococcidiopsis cubana SAG 39.79]
MGFTTNGFTSSELFWLLFTMLIFELFMQNYNDEITEKFKCDRTIYWSEIELIITE